MAEDNQAQDAILVETTGQAPADDGQQDEALDAASLMAELKRVRRESARYRTQLRELQSQAEEAAKAQLPEVDRLKADLAKAQAAMAERETAMAAQRLRSAVLMAAARAGFQDPEDAFRMIDVSELDVDGDQVGGVDEALAALRKSKPYLVRGAGTPAIPPTNPAGQRALTRDDIRAMSQDEINRRWDEVEKVLAQ